jgi:hypothetical protein
VKDCFGFHETAKCRGCRIRRLCKDATVYRKIYEGEGVTT